MGGGEDGALFFLACLPGSACIPAQAGTQFIDLMLPLFGIQLVEHTLLDLLWEETLLAHKAREGALSLAWIPEKFARNFPGGQ